MVQRRLEVAVARVGAAAVLEQDLEHLDVAVRGRVVHARALRRVDAVDVLAAVERLVQLDEVVLARRAHEDVAADARVLDVLADLAQVLERVPLARDHVAPVVVAPELERVRRARLVEELLDLGEGDVLGRLPVHAADDVPDLDRREERRDPDALAVGVDVVLGDGLGRLALGLLRLLELRVGLDLARERGFLDLFDVLAQLLRLDQLFALN